MNINILKTYISRLGFVSKRTKRSYDGGCEINITNIDSESHKIEGTVVIKINDSERDVIYFETQLVESPELLIFKSIYHTNTYKVKENQNSIKPSIYPLRTEFKISETTDTFAIVNKEMRYLFSPKTKFILHLIDGNINQIYCVSNKYNFNNGLSENFTRLNMNNKDIINDINNKYEETIRKRR